MPIDHTLSLSDEMNEKLKKFEILTEIYEPYQMTLEQYFPGNMSGPANISGWKKIRIEFEGKGLVENPLREYITMNRSNQFEIINICIVNISSKTLWEKIKYWWNNGKEIESVLGKIK